MKYLFIIVVFSLAINLYAQGDYKKIDDKSNLEQQIKSASKRLKTLQANFVQEKNLTFLDEIIQSKGRFVFKAENSVRWEYTEPFMYLIIIDNGQIIIKDDQKENKVDMASNPIFKQINQLMMSTVKGDILLNKDFNSQAYQNTENYKIVMEPTNPNMKEFISQIVLILRKSDMTVKSIKMIEPMGDYTFIRFKNKQLNVSIPENSFRIR